MTCIKSKNGRYRYILKETYGPKPLICIGVNPSTANENALDKTTTIVRNFAIRKKYDGFIMLNIYPEYSTNPDDLSKKFQKKHHNENLKQIKKILKNYPDSDIWLAFGSLIFKREYLVDCTKDILICITDRKTYRRGNLTDDGCPHHPIGISYDEDIQKFNVKKFLKTL